MVDVRLVCRVLPGGELTGADDAGERTREPRGACEGLATAGSEGSACRTQVGEGEGVLRGSSDKMLTSLARLLGERERWSPSTRAVAAMITGAGRGFRLLRGFGESSAAACGPS